jgi:polyisoprenoid-binding protein YceI
MIQILSNSAVSILITTVLTSSNIYAAKHDIDNQRSTITIHVSRSGLLSTFGHDHEITTRISRGYIEYPENPSVELWIDARALRVVDSNASAKDRAEVQTTMEGPGVLDVHGFPEIHFRSTVASRQNGGNRWSVRGSLDLHGQTRPVVLEITESNGSFLGTATLKLRDYGIRPPAVAGGSVKVKDEIKLDFKVATAQQASLLGNRPATPAGGLAISRLCRPSAAWLPGWPVQSSARSRIGD